ncbi:MAG: hypothetical protein IKZ88_10090 [Neisseriaceae bacterium]|nr:hypothetical protein [Neisseriaceae bacterium]MBR5941592.1 hypothetical protein [Neisseriaceae bacterium]
MSNEACSQAIRLDGYIVNSDQNYPALERLAVLFILSSAFRLGYFWSELTIF